VASVPAFLDELSRRIAPGCDPAVVRATASAVVAGGRTSPRRHDGRRASVLTPSGVPFEASVTGGGGRSAASVRFVGETGTGLPFFGPRLAAQRRALDEVARWLPPTGPAEAGLAELRGALDVLFPDPAAVPARTRFATFLGVVHRPEWPAHLAGLKLYGNLRAYDPPATLVRLRDRWPAFRDMHDLVGDLSYLVPQFTTLEVDAAGRVGHKLYVRTRPGPPGRHGSGANATGLAVLARRFGADLAPLADELRAAGVPPEVWQRPLFLCCARHAAGVELSVHLSAAALGLDAAPIAGLAGGLAARHGDPAGFAALAHAIDRAGGADAWAITVVGVGLVAGGGLGKVNVYAAPTGVSAGPG
jgi:hypothetical protein